MPNWCQNILTVTESTPELESFLKENGLSFEAAAKPNRPEPESDPSNFGTVDTQVAAWGTKWDLSKEDQKECGDNLLQGRSCWFDTAWSPPSEAIRALSELTGASFALLYYEGGMMFYGAEAIENGIIETLEVGDSKEDFQRFLIDEMGFDPEDAREEVFGAEEEEDEPSVV